MENLLKTDKEAYAETSKKLTEPEIEFLVQSFSAKERCVALSILALRSEINSDVYPFWAKFEKMLDSPNSFEKSIGLKMISINTKWDNGKFDIQKYLKLSNDPSLVVARACIQGLKTILINKNFNEKLCSEIKAFLSVYDIKKRPQTNWNVLEKDISEILNLIAKN